MRDKTEHSLCQHDDGICFVFTDHFSGPGTAVVALSVSVSMCPDNNFWTRRPL